jgi:pimeloyl-ACP methyl ester carboxylesterase
MFGSDFAVADVLHVRRTLLSVVVVCLLVAVGARPHAQITPPPPGRLIDLGGWRMHLHCTGSQVTAAPTVVLESGIGDSSIEWSLLQPRVAAFARVCSYDRSGTAWSDPGPAPHTGRQIVYELRALLASGGESPPYVLLGHSMGGRYVRMFASTYRDVVAGVVLVDANHEDDLLNINGKWFASGKRRPGRRYLWSRQQCRCGSKTCHPRRDSRSSRPRDN